jgi:diacylglycerol kinase family enzyme
VIAVLLNPAAGVGKTSHLPRTIEETFAASGAVARVTVLESADITVDEVKRALDSGASVVTAGGGDGTVSTIAGALLGSGVALGVLPLGTLNHFAKDLGVPMDLDKAIGVVADGRRICVDVGEVNGRIFINNSSIGIYPDIVVEREALCAAGHRKWPAFVVATGRVLRRYQGVVVRVSSEGHTETFRTPFLFIGNNQYQVDGIKIGRRGRLDQGTLYAYVAPRVRAEQLPRLAATALLGRATANPSLRAFATTELQVSTPGRPFLRVAVDGEVTHLAAPLEYRVRAGALEVMAPTSAST